MVKLCAPNLVVYTVSEIDRFSMKFTETICCGTKSSMAPMAERHLEAFAVVEVGGSKQPLVSTSRMKSFDERMIQFSSRFVTTKLSRRAA
jgi:hypothetical protein